MKLKDIQNLEPNFHILVKKVGDDITLSEIEKDLFRCQISEIVALIEDIRFGQHEGNVEQDSG